MSHLDPETAASFARLALEITRGKDPRAALSSVLDVAIQCAQAERACVVAPKIRGGFEVRAARMGAHDIRLDLAATSEGVIDEALRTTEPSFIENVLTHERLGSRSTVRRLKIQSAVVVPLVSPRGVFGALVIEDRRASRGLEPAQKKALVEIAQLATVAIEEIESRGTAEEAPDDAASAPTSGDRFGLIGRSKALEKVLEDIRRYGKTDKPVLIRGATGTGKEKIARGLHTASGRSAKKIVAVSAADLSEALIESELFGHKKGAFTGAVEDKKGLFALAHRGTLFLDEIGELSAGSQAKLLRVLQEKKVRQIGGSKDEDADARFICATNRDLKAMVKDGQFREDLYFRIAVLVIEVPPLRDRGGDVLLLAEHVLEELAREQGRRRPKVLTPEARAALARYEWPGNVRELQGALAAAHVHKGESVKLEHLKLGEGPVAPGSAPVTLDDAERATTLRALEKTGWNVSRAAKILGTYPMKVHRLIEQWGLSDESEKRKPRP